MSDYKVVIKGNKEDMDINLVLNNLSILFKSDPEKLRPFLASKSFIAKRLSDYETAKKYQKVLEDAGCITDIESEFFFDGPESARVRPSQKVSASTDNSVTAKSKPQNHEKQSITTEETTTNEVPIKSLDKLNIKFKFFIRFMLQQTHHVWNKVIKNPVVIATLVISSLMFGLFWVVAPANMKDKVVGVMTFASAERQCFNYHKENYFKDPDSAYIENGFIRTKEEVEINPSAFVEFDSYVILNVQAKNSMGGYGSELITCPLLNDRFDRNVQRANDLYNQKRYAEALPFIQSLAEEGNAKAQDRLGFMYRIGIGVEMDDNQAVYWYSKAGEQGDKYVQNKLGDIYLNGRDVDEQDLTKAVYWYSKAAEQYHAGAQYKLGSMYLSGKGVTQDNTKAVYWYSKAAELYDAGAQYTLGSMYLSGKGVTQDNTKAVYWIKKAAEQGYALAQFKLRTMYFWGKGVAKDDKQSAYWNNKFIANKDLEKKEKAIQAQIELLGVVIND